MDTPTCDVRRGWFSKLLVTAKHADTRWYNKSPLICFVFQNHYNPQHHETFFLEWVVNGDSKHLSGEHRLQWCACIVLSVNFASHKLNGFAEIHRVGQIHTGVHSILPSPQPSTWPIGPRRDIPGWRGRGRWPAEMCPTRCWRWTSAFSCCRNQTPPATAGPGGQSPQAPAAQHKLLYHHTDCYVPTQTAIVQHTVTS